MSNLQLSLTQTIGAFSSGKIRASSNSFNLRILPPLFFFILISLHYVTVFWGETYVMNLGFRVVPNFLNQFRRFCISYRDNFLRLLPKIRYARVSEILTQKGIPFSKPKSGGPVIVDIPLEKIRRPLMRTRANDQEKVKDLMESIREIGLQEPIDVLEVEGIYYGFSGCHRFEAHQQLGLPTIRCKIRRGTKETLRHHMR